MTTLGYAVSGPKCTCEIAPPTKRVAAAIVTTAVFAIIYLMWGWAMNTILALDQLLVFYGLNARTADIVAFFVILAGPLCWLVLDGAFMGATYGMRKAHLTYCSQERHRISFGRCALRIVVGILVIPALPISCIVVARDHSRRSIADILCTTTVCVRAE